MHANSLKNLKPWRPGQSGYAGHAKIPAELRAIKSLTQLEVTKLISKYARMSSLELSVALERKDLPILELAFISIFQKSVEDGDFTRIAFLLDRCIGKVKEVVEDEEERAEREELSKIPLQDLLKLVQSNLPEDK